MKVNDKKQQETIDDLKEQMKVNNKKQETINLIDNPKDNLKQERINLKEPINNLTTINNEEPMDDKLITIINILKEPTINNKNL